VAGSGYDTIMTDEVHPKSPCIGDIVRCTNNERHLTDPKGYRVEHVGNNNPYAYSALTYGHFTARGVRYGGLYLFSVDEYEKA
jgi:hypothetical protein